MDFEADTVETEKRFEQKISYIDFKYDVFAESKDRRVVVEIQRVDYDYNFDRFLLYHNMAIAEMLRTSAEYKTHRIVSSRENLVLSIEFVLSFDYQCFMLKV